MSTALKTLKRKIVKQRHRQEKLSEEQESSTEEANQENHYYMGDARNSVLLKNLNDQFFKQFQIQLAKNFSNYLTHQSLYSQACQSLIQFSVQKKILCFDIDETLAFAHCKDQYAHELIVCKNSTLKVRLRPHSTEVLARLSQFFQIVLFTSGIQQYACKLKQMLDPQNKVISRLFDRSHCILHKGNYIKNLKAVTSDLSKIILIDNSMHSYVNNVCNGVPILPYLGSLEDTQLLRLQRFLGKFKNVVDVRPLIKSYFQFQWLYKGGWYKQLEASLAIKTIF